MQERNKLKLELEDLNGSALEQITELDAQYDRKCEQMQALQRELASLKKSKQLALSSCVDPLKFRLPIGSCRARALKDQRRPRTVGLIGFAESPGDCRVAA